MKIDILTVKGSPKDITAIDIFGRGVGGAELALISWAEVMAKRGHQIRIFNQTQHNTYNINNVGYMPDIQFIPNEERDVLITFRGPAMEAIGANGKQIGWSCDQYSIGSYDMWYNSVEKMILISDFHKQDHVKRYGEVVNRKGQVIDLGVRTWEYYCEDEKTPPQKIPYSFIFCSVPDRGLNLLASVWPKIKETFPEASLTITSDYTLWGAASPLNMEYRMKFAGMPGVRFLGNIPRIATAGEPYNLMDEQLKAEVNLYPCIYDENFCIAIAECQVAGVYCLTTNQGALATTNFTGETYPGFDFDNMLYDLQNFYANPSIVRLAKSQEIKKQALERFDWNVIAAEWEKVFNE